MAIVRPITQGEFLKTLLRCKPPLGWQGALAIGNSGGSDSTCLLFLLHSLISQNLAKTHDIPPSVISVTVDHLLQPSSTSTTEFCARNAEALGISHHTGTIRWGEAPCPPKPQGADAIEAVARDARFHVLFHSMSLLGVRTLALGHHADDQVETSLMRLARGTTELGAAGMRRIRRWGMGFGSGPSALGWAGYPGMSRFIIRPMLDFSKDRILATCEQNKLEYVTDNTNFQPNLTIRNALRHMLAEEQSLNDGSKTQPDAIDLLPDIAQKLEDVKIATKNLRSVYYDISGGREQLYGAVRHLTTRVEDVDTEVTSHLKRRSLPCPPSTFLLSTHNLSSIREETIRKAMVLRILRYCSFHPWGSLRADSNRRTDSILRIVQNIWHPNPFETGITRFAAGGGVVWTPVGISEGKIQLPETVKKRQLVPKNFAWLASRQPPLKHRQYAQMNLERPLERNVTPLILDRSRSTDEVELLYDNRFLLSFATDKIPHALIESISRKEAEVLVVTDTQWWWPKVVLHLPGTSEDRILARIAGGAPAQGSSAINLEGEGAAWTSIKWIRLLDAT